jgi:polar amino acid transport system substrate-binding protein
MKRIAAVAILALTVTAVASGARSGKAPEPFASKGSFLVCVDVGFPPMEYYAKVGSTTPTGFDVDLAKAVAKGWGIKVKFVPTAFTGLLPALSSKKCDLIWSGIFVTPERTKQFPAVPYMKSRRALLVKAGNPENITSPQSLSGKTVSTEAGTKYVDALKLLDKQLKAKGKPGITIQTYPKATDASAAVLTGRRTRKRPSASRRTRASSRSRTCTRRPTRSASTTGATHPRSGPRSAGSSRR